MGLLWVAGSLAAVFVAAAPALAQEGGFGLQEDTQNTGVMESTTPVPQEETTAGPEGPGASVTRQPAYERTPPLESQYGPDADQYAAPYLADTGGLDLAAAALGGILVLLAAAYLTALARGNRTASERGEDHDA